MKKKSACREESFLRESSPGSITITIHAVAEPTGKRRGDAAEAAFLARASTTESLAFAVSPLGRQTVKPR
jgi:hypothetical protein